jgi:hypothetical protein
MERLIIAQAIRETIEEIRTLELCNHDHIENKVTDGVTGALERLAGKLDGGES